MPIALATYLSYSKKVTNLRFNKQQPKLKFDQAPLIKNLSRKIYLMYVSNKINELFDIITV